MHLKDHEHCGYCGNPLAAGAGFCPACGEEQPGYAEELMRREPPLTPGFDRRWQIQGQAATHLLLALLAALLVGAGLFFSTGLSTTGLLLADLALAAAISACAWPMRAELAPLMRSGSWTWLGVALGAGLLLPGLAVVYLNAFGLDSGTDPWSGDETVSGPAPWALLLSLVVVAGVFEEIAFRGIFLSVMKSIARPRNAHLLTAAVFAGIHFEPAVFPYHFLVGLCLGWLRERSAGLLAPMSAHAMHNLAVIYVWV